MKIHNIRLGYAHNSSSTHSIVFLPGPGASKIDDHGGLEFGWDFFTVGDEERKLRYLAHLLEPTLGREKTKELTGVNADNPAWYPSDDDDQESFVDYIDHQSVWGLPMNFAGEPNEQFAAALIEMFKRDDVAILGGNDNTDESHHVLGIDGVREVPGLGYFSAASRVRYDRTGNFWTMFVANGYNAGKVRFSLEEGDVVVKKADTPELVDVKITDYCGFGCSYCYMGSTKKGLHAEMPELEMIADALRDMEVFEVALGGGEPTHHPQFMDILRMFRSRGIIPNFTTRNADILRGDIRKEIDELCGSFAFSVDSAESLRAVMAHAPDASHIPPAPPHPLTEDYGVNYEDDNYYNSDAYQRFSAAQRAFYASAEYIAHQEASTAYRETDEYKQYEEDRKFNPPNVQVVMGTVSDEDFEGILDLCHQGPSLTLLGYKTTGRGGAFEPKPTDNWVDRYIALREDGHAPYRLGIDTVLAAQIEGRLEALNVPKASYETEEGKFSMYIDAIDMKMGKCSYVDDKEYTELSYDPVAKASVEPEIRRAFAQW
jgi:organic radical activating enzyme